MTLKKLILIAMLAMSALLSGCNGGGFIRNDFVISDSGCQGMGYVQGTACQAGVNDARMETARHLQDEIRRQASDAYSLCYDAVSVDERGRVFFNQPKIPLDRREIGIACADGRRDARLAKTQQRASEVGRTNRDAAYEKGRLLGSQDQAPAPTPKK